MCFKCSRAVCLKKHPQDKKEMFMAKKILVFLLVLVLCTSVFAAKSKTDIYLGLGSGYSQRIQFNEHSNVTTSYVPVEADALFCFGDSLALSLGLGTDIYIPSSDIADPSAYLLAEAFVYYRLNMGKTASLLIGGGMDYQYKSIKDIDTSLHLLALLANIRIQADMTDNIGLFAEGQVGYEVMSRSVTKTILGDASVDNENLRFVWAAKAGIQYKF